MGLDASLNAAIDDMEKKLAALVERIEQTPSFPWDAKSRASFALATWRRVIEALQEQGRADLPRIG